MSGLAFPRWAYVPGKATEPDRAPLAQAKQLIPPRFDTSVPADHPAVRYGLALNDAGYFWESHEILEAVWKVAPQGGRDRILLRACIQIANANLKVKMDRPRAAVRLLEEALAELDELSVRRPGDAPGSFAVTYSAAILASTVRAGLRHLLTSRRQFCLPVAVNMKQNAELASEVLDSIKNMHYYSCSETAYDS